MRRLVMLGALLGGPALAQPAPAPLVVTSAQFLQDVYACSPFGDVAQLNPLWWATQDGAKALCARVGAIAIQKDTTPQTGPALTRWRVVRVPVKLLPPAGARVTDPAQMLAILALPQERMWAAVFTNGCVVNAGYLLDYYRRKAADAQVKAIIAGECAQGLAAKKKVYPPFFEDGKERKR